MQRYLLTISDVAWLKSKSFIITESQKILFDRLLMEGCIRDDEKEFSIEPYVDTDVIDLT